MKKILATASPVAVLILLLLPAGGTAASQPNVADVAFAGCSTTTQAVHGYALQDGGSRLWRPSSFFDGKGALGVYPGGTPTIWVMAKNSPVLPHWSQLETMAKAQPNVSMVWFQVCMGAGDDVGPTLGNARLVADILHHRFPDATLYVSPMTGYVTPPPQLGEGPERSVAVASQLVSEGLGVEGPVLPKLQDYELLRDATHENVLGMWRMGRALLRFFGSYAALENHSAE